MKTHYFFKLAIFSFVIECISIASANQPKEGNVVDVWPYGKMPLESTSSGQICYNKVDNVFIKNVSNPTLETYLVKSDKPQGVVIICPGGGYKFLAYDHEGTRIAKEFNKNGISAVVLKYRVPNVRESALADIQRAIRLVRSKEKDWNIDPNKIAVMGFSAGANLCTRASTEFDKVKYKPIDSADNLSARPDLACIIYPAYIDEPTYQERLMGAKKERKDYNFDYELAKELSIPSNTPPTFIMQTQPDPYVNASIAYYLALKDKNIPTTLHLFDEAQHGVGLNKTGKLVDKWLTLCINWLKSNKWQF